MFSGRLRRLGNAVLAKLLRIVVERELAVVQMGVAPGGIENVVHAVQHFLFSEVRGSTPSAKFVIALDLKNAFNALSRADLVQLIRRISPQLLPYFRTSLGVPGPVRMQRSRDLVQTVMARSGVPQGSPLSSLLFAMMTMGPLLRAQHEHPGVRIMAAHDDAYILAANAQEGYDALVTLSKYFQMLGLELSVEKTVIYSPTEDVTSDAFAPTWGRFRRVPPNKGIIVLGTPVGSLDYVRSQVCSIFATYDSKWERVSHALRDRKFRFALHRVVERHHPMYLLRTLSPGQIHNQVAQMDQSSDRLFARLAERQGHLLQATAYPLERLQASLPIRYGGLGMWRYSSIHEFAWLDSCFAALNCICSLCGGWSAHV